MYFLTRPSPSAIAAFIDAQSRTGFSYSEVGATKGKLPANYSVDHNRVELGKGEEVFRRASSELRAWRMFDLGWSQLFQPTTPIEPGAVVAARFHHFGFWSLNACRIVYTFSEDRRFGFAYGTLEDHAETGEERFSIEWSRVDDSVFYDILAFSRPKHWTARIGKPIARALQRKFVRDSKAVMVRAVSRRWEL
jgi:uncharacterized protein (UPF0548 family)